MEETEVKTEVKPLAEWLQEEEKDGECRPCGIAVILGDYQKVLEAGGYPEFSQEIAEALSADEDDPILQVAQVMDKAKEKVDDELRGFLLELDSLAQETIEEGGNTNGNLSEQHPEGEDPGQGAAGSPGDEGACT